MRGEHDGGGLGEALGEGSSPRARGTPDDQTGEISNTGIIPACAGNTPTASKHDHKKRDHPRVRGEHRCCQTFVCTFPGSSPRARGTQVVVDPIVLVSGIIPACAGNTEGFRLGACCGRDHPRVRGEHAIHAPAAASVQGSSPRARGTQRIHHERVGLEGIIPACAGNTR